MKKISFTIIITIIVFTGCETLQRFVPEEKPATGCIKGDCKNGRGLFIWKDGRKYEGNYSNGKFHGKGVYTLASGMRYEGVFEHGEFSGIGKIVYKDGSQISGFYKEGELKGHGTLYNKEGKIEYTGQWKNGDYNGHGVKYEYFKNGTKRRKIKGEFKEGIFSGKGTIFDYHNDGSLKQKVEKIHHSKYKIWMYYLDGTKIEGVFDQDYLIGRGKGEKIFPDGKRYQGPLKHGLADGEGTLFDKNGQKMYSGKWHLGQMHGKGKLIFDKEYKYYGHFKYGKFHGKGTYKKYDEFGNLIYQYRGHFKDGNPYGKGTALTYNRNGKVIKRQKGWWKGEKFLGN